MWQNDSLFAASDIDGLEELGAIASPAFRLSAQASVKDGHPLDHVERYDRLFRVFRPLLEKRAERLTMVEAAGAKSRRRTSITSKDWQPFHFMKDVIDNDDRHWIGFDFKSGKTAKLFDRGPTGFRFRVARTVQIDVTFAIDDLGEIDMAALKAAMLQLPVRSALAGYGMALSSLFDGYETPHGLLTPVALKYPVVDVCASDRRSWFPDDEGNFKRDWIGGINWLTQVGQAHLAALGGLAAIAKNLPREIEVTGSDDMALFQLGERPITGEKGQDDALLPLYHALGRKLQPPGEGGPSSNFPRQPVFGNGREDRSLLWERRFYDGKWFEEISA